MKNPSVKMLSIAALLIIAGNLPAQLSQINTSNRQTNVTTTAVVVTIPGLVTNAPATIQQTNVVIGDTLPTAFGKVNNGWLWLGTVVRATNGTIGYIPYYTNAAPGYFWGPAPTGGGSATNSIPIYSGGGTNLTVTNRFTLLSTDVYYTYSSITISNQGTFYDAGGGYYTNTNGAVITIFGTGNDPSVPGDPTNGLPVTSNPITTNSTSPVNGFASQVNLIQVTNGPGAGWYYPFDPFHFIFIMASNTVISTNYYAGAVTNVTVVGAGSTGVNGTYYGSTNTGFTSYSNSLIYINNYGFNAFYGYNQWKIVSNGVSLYTSGQGSPVGSWILFSGNSPTPMSYFGSTLVTNNTTNTTAWFTYYSTNAWRFFSSTNAVTFSSPVETISGTGISQSFYVTNVSINPVTNASPTNASTSYLANNGSTVTFYGLYLGTNGYYWSGYIPGVSNTVIITWTNTSPTSPPPGVSSSPCQTYICATVGGVCKTLTDGWKMVQEVAAYNTQSGLATSHLDIETNGTATLVLFDVIVKTMPFSGSDWTLDVPADSCATCQQNSPSLPCSYGGFNSTGGGGAPPTQTVTVGGSH